jgi:hypothetical protein
MNPKTQDQPATVATPKTEGGSAATIGSALGTPDEVRGAAKVLRRLINKLEDLRDHEHWWQHILADYPIKDLRWTAQRLEETADKIEVQNGKASEPL